MGMKTHLHHNFWSQIDANAAGDAVLGMTAGEAYLYENPKVPRAAQYAWRTTPSTASGQTPPPRAARTRSR